MYSHKYYLDRILHNKTRLEKINLETARLQEVLAGCKVLHLSDLHIVDYGYRERSLVSFVRRENPDLIFITGDLVNSYQNDFAACITTLKQITAKHGVYAVFGNAEHTFNPIDLVYDFKSALRDIDIIVLNNRSVEEEIGGKRLYIVGVDDPFFLFDQFEIAVRDVPAGMPMILLAHSPDILYPRSDAMVLNLIDSELKKNHHQGWGWAGSTKFGPESGRVYFNNNGIHTMRVQSRQDGVSLDTILLNPYDDINNMLERKDYDRLHNILTDTEQLMHYPDLIVISGLSVEENHLKGKWKKVHDTSALFDLRLDDLPAEKWYYQPLIEPLNYFECSFTAKKGTEYHVWMRMKAYNGSPFSDSVYLQFGDSVDRNGKSRFRMNMPAYCKDRLDEVDLILTGHTHGGQICLPLYGPVATMTTLGKKYASGLHMFGNSKVYISRGYGTSVIPFRFLCPPEITVFTFN